MKRKDGHVQLGLTVFFTVSAILLLYDTFFGSRVLQSFGRQFLSALSPVLYGAFMAYLLAPMVNYFEELFLPKGKKIEKGKRTSGPEHPADLGHYRCDAVPAGLRAAAGAV